MSRTVRWRRPTRWSRSSWRKSSRDGRVAVSRAAHAQVVEAYLDHLAVERGLAANTLAAYRRDLTRYADHLAATGRGLEGVDERGIAAYLRSLREDPLAPL